MLKISQTGCRKPWSQYYFQHSATRYLVKTHKKSTELKRKSIKRNKKHREGNDAE